MSRIDELLHEPSLHSVRSDGSQMIALAMGSSQQGQQNHQTQQKSETHSVWELLFLRKGGQVENDGSITLDTGEKAILRKLRNINQLQKAAARHDFVEWRPGVLEEHPDEQVLMLQDQLQRATYDLEEMTKKCQTLEQQVQEKQKLIDELTAKDATQRKQEQVAQRKLQEIEERVKRTAAAVAERTPSETQKIIANQVELGAGYYEQVGVQSHESFRLSLWLTVAGGCIFLITMLATVFVSLFRGGEHTYYHHWFDCRGTHRRASCF